MMMKKAMMTMMAFAMAVTVTLAQAPIEPEYLAVAYHKTTNLVFPYNIKSVDRGSRDVLVQKAKNVENVLQVKAGHEDFEQTNLTVITADGHLYSFLVGYSDKPDLNVVMDVPRPDIRTGICFTEKEDNESAVTDAAERVARKKHFLSKKDSDFDITLELGGIYVVDGLMYFQLQLKNDSHIGYDIGQLRFFIRDKRKAKRTASQELELEPLFIQGNVTSIDGESTQQVVVVLEKFTIPDKKYLAIQMMEAGGGRHLELREGNRTLIKSRLLR